MEEIDVKAVVDYCKLESLKENENGWRAATFYGNGSKDTKQSLSISKEGAFKCFKTEKSGHVVELYADRIGKPMDLARAELKKLKIIPEGFKFEKKIDEDKEKQEEKKKQEKLKFWIESLDKTKIDVKKLANWRGISPEQINLAINGGALSAVEQYPELGNAYAFILTSPLDFKTKAIQYRSFDPEIKPWRATGSYPLWTPSLWDKNAKEVWITEGQWDCLALYSAMEQNAPEKCQKIQFAALSGPKNLSAHKDILDYLKGKTIVLIPDNDEKGEKILVDTHKQLEDINCNIKLLRIDKKNGKDFNDWLRLGINKESFELWIESSEPLKISQGIVIDSQYKIEHNLSFSSEVEIGEDGEAHELYDGDSDIKSKFSPSEVLKITKAFPLFNDYVESCLEVGESPAPFHLASALTYTAGVCGKRFKLKSGITGELYPNLYTLLVGPSGIGKGQAMMALKPIVARSCKGIFLPQSVSRESLMDEMGERSQRILVNEEYSVYLRSKEGNYMYQVLKGKIEIYDAHHYSVDMPWKMSFRQSGSVEISDPILSILSSCTSNEVVYSQDTLKGGIVGRFAFPIGFEKSQEIDFPGQLKESILNQWESFFKGIFITPIRTNVTVGLSSEALQLFTEANKKQNEMVKHVDKNGLMGTATSRWKIHVLKYAMLFEISRLHHVPNIARSDFLISAESMGAGIAWQNLMQTSFLHIFEKQFKGGTDVPESRIHNKVLEFMHNNSNGAEGISRTQLYRHMHMTERVLEPVLKSLEVAGQIFSRTLKNGGRPKTVFLLAKEKPITNGYQI